MAPQVGLPKVLRWKKYIDKEQGVRTQDSLQHSHAIAILGAMMLAQLQPYAELDQSLVLTALTIHDVGEGEIQKDTLYIDKTVAGDLEEYVAFWKRYASVGSVMFEPLHRAFLLQFARKNPEIFPAPARLIMADLATRFSLEALVFDAVERWDYVLYAFEQYYFRRNEMILTQVLRAQVGHLDRLAKELPGFGEVIWTKEISCWVDGFLQERHGKWIEQKGEV